MDTAFSEKIQKKKATLGNGAQPTKLLEQVRQSLRTKHSFVSDINIIMNEICVTKQ